MEWLLKHDDGAVDLHAQGFFFSCEAEPGRPAGLLKSTMRQLHTPIAAMQRLTSTVDAPSR